MTGTTPDKEKTQALRNEAIDWLLRIDAAPDDAAARVERDAWLHQSEAHAEAYRRAEQTWQLAGDVPPVHAHRWPGKARAAPRTAPTTVIQAGPARRRRGPAWGVAAAVLAACLALFFVGPTLQLRLQADYVSGTGEGRQVMLADGTTVDLDTASAISARVAASGRDAALLSGRAFFQVVPDRERRFSVVAGNATVVVTGTAFSVDLAPDTIAVAVQSGSVTVRDDRGNAAGTRLQAGDRLRIDRATAVMSRDRIPAAQVAAWRHGQLVVEDVTIAEVVDELRRYHRGFVVIRDEALARRRVTGVYDLRDPEAALRAVVQPYAGSVRAVTPYLLVVSGG